MVLRPADEPPALLSVGEVARRSGVAVSALHFYEAQVFEIVRVSYLLANRCCVVSEAGFDTKLEASVGDGVAFVPYDAVVATCLRLLSDDAERTSLAQRGFDCFRSQSQVPMLKRALDATSSAKV